MEVPRRGTSIPTGPWLGLCWPPHPAVSSYVARVVSVLTTTGDFLSRNLNPPAWRTGMLPSSVYSPPSKALWGENQITRRNQFNRENLHHHHHH